MAKHDRIKTIKGASGRRTSADIADRVERKAENKSDYSLVPFDRTHDTLERWYSSLWSYLVDEIVARHTPNTQGFHPVTITFLGEINPASFSNEQAFYSHKIDREDTGTLSPTAFSNTQTFNTHKQSLLISSTSYENTQSFNTQEIVFSISPSAFENTQTFNHHTLSTIAEVTATTVGNSSGATEATTTVSHNHPSGSNRLLAFVGCAKGTTGAFNSVSATYGGNTMTELEGIGINSSPASRTDEYCFSLHDDDVVGGIPTGANDLVVSADPNSRTTMRIYSISNGNTLGTAVADTAQGSVTTIDLSVPSVNTDLVFRGVHWRNSDAEITFPEGQTGVDDQDVGGQNSRAGSSWKRATGGPTAMPATVTAGNSSQRFAMVGVSVGVTEDEELLGTWSLSETSGDIFADSTGNNDATLNKPSWTVDTHKHDRPGIVDGLSDTSLEISNGGPEIQMKGIYKNDNASLVIYVNPLSELRGTQYWVSSDERYGREYIAFCDDGSTPGSFAIYRRRPNYDIEDRSGTSEWRLGGYVRDNAGNKEYFGGSIDIATALLPVDTTKCIVLTQGAAGGELWLDGGKVGTVTSTEGWKQLGNDICIGSSGDAVNHANDRSPLWARVQEIRIYRGQLAVASLPAVKQSRRWKAPSDFVGAGTDIDIADHAAAANPLQAAVDAADTAGVYVFQAEADTTDYIQPALDPIEVTAGCKGMVGVRIKKADGEEDKWISVVRVTVPGTFRFVGVRIDGNGRGQDWHPKSGEAGFTYTDFDLQQAHGLRAQSKTSGQDVNMLVDACEFHDGTGDACSAYNRSQWTVESCRFYGYFRGPLVINSDGEVSIDARRCESHSESRLRPGVFNGCGLCDIEPFGSGVDAGRSVRTLIADMWAESDIDDAPRQIDDLYPSWTRFYNIHDTGSAFNIFDGSSAHSWEARPVSERLYQRSTIAYWRRAQGGGNFPAVKIEAVGPGDAGLGCLFDHCVFLASGLPYCHHEDALLRPVDDSTLLCRIEVVDPAGTHPTGRWITIRDSELRPMALPAGMAQADKRFLRFASLDTSAEIEFDGFTIDGDFADAPIDLGGVTVRHRNVLHERTSSTTPWINAGATVAI